MPLKVRIRAARSADLPFVLGLVPRLVAFGPPPWRSADAIAASSAALLRSAIDDPRDGLVLIAEREEDGAPLGFVQLATDAEFFTGEPQAYIPNLAVAPEGEGKGVGRALIAAAEHWARSRGLVHLTLYVFAGNTAARSFYDRLGFAEDSLKLIRRVDP